MLSRILAILIVGLIALGVYSYPFAQIFLAFSLTLYAFVLIKSPLTWLWLIPVLLPVLNLAPWSGRFFLEEFDFYLGLTLAMGLWRKVSIYGFRVCRGGFNRPGRMNSPLQGISFSAKAATQDIASIPQWKTACLIGCFALSYSISLMLGLLPLTPIDANSFNNEYSHYNALRVGRGGLWAFLMLPLLLQAFKTNRQKARHFLTQGMCFGLLCTGLIVLWERGVLIDMLYGQNRFERLDHFLNFSTDYRITSVFSEMRTGGEVIDAYLLLAMPFSLALLFKPSPEIFKGVISWCVALYCALVTFSRGTYLAVAVLIAVRMSLEHALRFLTLTFTAFLLNLYGFVQGGFMVLAGGLIAWGSSAYGLLKRFGWLAWAIAFFLMLKGFTGSKWVIHSFFESIYLSFGLCLLLILSGTLLYKRLNVPKKAVFLSVSLIGMGLLIPALSGFRMENRFNSSQDDFMGRFSHWRYAVELMDKDFVTQLFGMGIGRFPLTYALSQPVEKMGGHARFQQEGANHYLRLSGGKDLRMLQRLSLAQDRDYRLSFKARTEDGEAHLRIRFCRRNIIYPNEWNADCLSFEKRLKRAGWQDFSEVFNLRQLGDGKPWGRQPLAIEISNRREYAMEYKPATSIDLDDIEVFDEQGLDHVRNGDFESGSDFWFQSFDFNYLPWHIENIWVSLYFEQGLWGVLSFAGLIFAVLHRAYRQARLGDWFASSVFSAMIAFFTLGLFASLFDAPRITLLFFLLVFSMLADDGKVFGGERP